MNRAIKMSVAGLAAAAGLTGQSLGQVNIGFEAAEGYALGNINGQNGWVTNVGLSGTPGTTTVADGISAGNGSANALRLGKGSQSAGTQANAQYNTGTLGQYFSFQCDVRIDDVVGSGAAYTVLAINGLTSTQTWRVNFEYTGDISIGGTFIPTGFTWTQNTWKTLDIEIGASNIAYYYGGSLIYTGAFVTPGNTVDKVRFFHDNFQASSGNAGYFDNIKIAVPAPASAALLGMGGLIAARRRRF